MPKKTTGMSPSDWKELLTVAGLSAAVAFAGFFWDLSKNGRDLVAYTQKALTQKSYVAVTFDASGLRAHGVAADGTYDIQSTATPEGDEVRTILAELNGSNLGAFRFSGTAGGQVVGTGEPVTPAGSHGVPDPAKPLTFLGPAADPNKTLAITSQGTKSVGTDSFLRFEIIPGPPAGNIVTRGVEAYLSGFSRNAERVFVYVNSRTRLPAYVLETGPAGLSLTVYRYGTAASVGEAWSKFQESGAQKLAFFGINPTESAQILSER